MKSFCQYMGCSYEFEGKYHFNSDMRNFISRISPLCSLLYTLLKDKYMCLQDEGKLLVTRPAGQVQY